MAPERPRRPPPCPQGAQSPLQCLSVSPGYTKDSPFSPESSPAPPAAPSVPKVSTEPPQCPPSVPTTLPLAPPCPRCPRTPPAAPTLVPLRNRPCRHLIPLPFRARGAERTQARTTRVTSTRKPRIRGMIGSDELEKARPPSWVWAGGAGRGRCPSVATSPSRPGEPSVLELLRAR